MRTRQVGFNTGYLYIQSLNDLSIKIETEKTHQNFWHGRRAGEDWSSHRHVFNVGQKLIETKPNQTNTNRQTKDKKFINRQTNKQKMYVLDQSKQFFFFFNAHTHTQN